MPSLASFQRRAREVYAPAPMRDFDDFDAYWERRGDLEILPHRWVVAARLIPDGARVLDLGSGSGQFLRYLREQRPGCTIRGSDSSAKAREMIEASGFEALDIDVSCDELPTDVDIITMFEVLEHIPEAEAAIQRLVAAAGDKVILSVPNVGFIGSRVRLAIFGRFPVTNCVYHIKEHLRHWTPKDFRDWTGQLGIRIVHQEGQYGPPGIWKVWPSLWAQGMVYAVEPTAPTTP